MGRTHTVDRLGPFVAPARVHVTHPEAHVRDRAVARPVWPRLAPAELSLEFGVASRSVIVQRRRRVTTTCSILVHLLGVTGALVIPVLLSPALPDPARPVHAFFVEPLDAPAPPPPPSPRASHAAARPAAQATPAATAAFTAPLEVARELKPEEWLDLADEGGTSGGVDGGIPGGVLGAIVGGLPAATAEVPVPPPVRVSGLVKEPVKLVHVDPVYPPVAVAGHVEGVVVIDALIDQRGHVVEATIVRGHPIFEQAAVEAVRRWVYTPTLVDGVPVRVLMTITVRFRLTS